jgi:hypothetical protein
MKEEEAAATLLTLLGGLDEVEEEPHSCWAKGGRFGFKFKENGYILL